MFSLLSDWNGGRHSVIIEEHRQPCSAHSHVSCPPHHCGNQQIPVSLRNALLTVSWLTCQLLYQLGEWTADAKTSCRSLRFGAHSGSDRLSFVTICPFAAPAHWDVTTAVRKSDTIIVATPLPASALTFLSYFSVFSLLSFWSFAFLSSFFLPLLLFFLCFYCLGLELLFCLCLFIISHSSWFGLDFGALHSCAFQLPPTRHLPVHSATGLCSQRRKDEKQSERDQWMNEGMNEWMND